MTNVEVVMVRDNEVLLTTSKVAGMLGVHSNTVRRWTNEGLLPVYRIGPRRDRRVKKSDIDKFLQEHKQGASQETS